MNNKVNQFFEDLKKEDWIKIISGGTIDTDTILSNYMSTYKKNRVLKVHPYAITQLKEGRYSTYVVDEAKANHRRVVKAKDYDSLIDKLYDFYFKDSDVNAKRLCDIFEEWLEYTHLFKSKRKKASENMVFYPDEIEELIGELERGYSVNGNNNPFRENARKKKVKECSILHTNKGWFQKMALKIR